MSANSTLALLHGAAGANNPPALAAGDEDLFGTEPKAEAEQKPKKWSKKKTGLATTEPSVDGEVLGPDLLTTAAHEIENLAEQEAHEMVGTITDTNDFNAFKLGGVLAKINQEKWFGGHEDFKSYVQNKHGFALRKAFYLVSIYSTVVDLGLTWDKLKPVGWSKLKELVPVINKENAQDWINKASQPDMTVLKLHALVQAAKNDGQAQLTSEGAPQKTVNKTFKLHEDQVETVNAALEKAKQAAGTEHDSVAMEYVMLDYLGNSEKAAKAGDEIEEGGQPTASAAPQIDPANLELSEDNLAFFKAYMAKLGWEDTLAVFEQNFPDINLTVETP